MLRLINNVVDIFNHVKIIGFIVLLIYILYKLACFPIKFKFFKSKRLIQNYKSITYLICSYIITCLYVVNSSYIIKLWIFLFIIGVYVIFVYLVLRLMIEIGIKQNIKIMIITIYILIILFCNYYNVYPIIKIKMFKCVNDSLSIFKNGTVSDVSNLINIIGTLLRLFAIIAVIFRFIYEYIYSQNIQNRFGIPQDLVHSDFNYVLFNIIKYTFLLILLFLFFILLIYSSNAPFLFQILLLLSFLFILLFNIYIFFDLQHNNYVRDNKRNIMIGIIMFLILLIYFCYNNYELFEFALLVIAISIICIIFAKYLSFNNKEYVIIKQNNKYYAVITITKNDKFLCIEVIDDDNNEGNFTIKNKYEYKLFDRINLKNKKYRRVNAILL